ncbi:MutS family DNA mismatch repair protein [Bacteroides sp. 224]|uniref:MutS family DNA mismatch repair protein n=1 Tax=Bacteroides sp. 224 TaxID=2302936 RepID=UPI0013D1E1C9|nr:MutS family DNA mismatch repair protein [Bacteroides sp. 224]NDV63868.1 hypothetical protein [Bacteroides sp. 224]
MEALEKIKEIYQNIISTSELNLNKVQRRIYHIGSIRLLLFVGGIVGIIYFREMEWPVIAAIAVIAFVPFLILIKYHNRLFYKKEYLEKKIEINEQELKAIEYDISSFDGGKEFINSEHLYTYDLDIFGDRSLFQLVNRTSTEMGKNELAAWFNCHLKKKEEIEERQKGVEELTPELKFRQRFRIQGLLYQGKMADKKEIIDWAKSPSYFRSRKILRVLPAIVLSINIISILLAIAGISTFSLAGVVFVAFIVLSFTFTQKITRIQTMYGKKMQILATYAQLIQLIENQHVNSKVLQEVKELVGTDKKAASQSIKRLSSLMHALDQRNNMLMAGILNGLMLWELKQIMQIEAWREECAGDLPQWLEAIGKMDAYCSLATFAYNHPHFIIPTITDSPFHVTANALGHPLMNREKCVRNDIEMGKRPYFIIITGANMAGKSTYLRTVGVNYLLACMGAPVYATEMTVYPTKLVTSLRTTDSLSDNESYFFAELKRLKLIINMLENKEELFIILDEILKGTNSMDKQKGSIALIKQFMMLQTNGIIATHDLLLGSLADLYPDNIKNYRFEADIKNNELTFSYQLREGVAQNMNACFLMKKMGIAVVD